MSHIRILLSAALLFTLPWLAACSEEQSRTETKVEQSETAPVIEGTYISRFRIATIGAPDLADIEEAYSGWLGYQVVERGEVSPELAASWGAPKMAGRNYILMTPESGAEYYIRAVSIDPQPDYVPMTTLGWNAFELVVDDVYELYEVLKTSPFEIIGEPRSLGGSIASIHAMQVKGPAGEILYFNCETGDRSKSNLPIPQSFVGRLNIAILGSPDAPATQDYYDSKLGLKKRGDFKMPIANLAQVQGMPADHIYHLAMSRAGEKGNTIEIDGYPASAKDRKRSEGQLPPGNAMISYSTNDLSNFEVPFLAEAFYPVSVAYNGVARTLIGPAGELIEIIQEGEVE